MNWFGLKQCLNICKFPQNTFPKGLCKATHDFEGANEIVPPTKFNGDLRNSNTFHLLPVKLFVYLTFIQFLHYITIYPGHTRLCQSIRVKFVLHISRSSQSVLTYHYVSMYSVIIAE